MEQNLIIFPNIEISPNPTQNVEPDPMHSEIGGYETRILNPEAIDDCLELQKSILEKLGENQTLIHVNNSEDLKKKMSGRNSILGIFVNGKLVAQLCLTKADLSEEQKIPDHMPNLDSDNIYSVGGVLVHPDFRGHGLMSKMLSEINSFAKKKNITGLFAEVDTKNPFSFNNLLKAGFIIDRAYIDPSDGGETYLLYKDLQKNLGFSKKESESISLDIDSFDEINRKLGGNLCGVSYDRKTKTILVKGHSHNLDRNIDSQQQMLGGVYSIC